MDDAMDNHGSARANSQNSRSTIGLPTRSIGAPIAPALRARDITDAFIVDSGVAQGGGRAPSSRASRSLRSTTLGLD